MKKTGQFFKWRMKKINFHRPVGHKKNREIGEAKYRYREGYKNKTQKAKEEIIQ